MPGIGHRLLHGSAHVAESGGLHWWDVAAAALVVGSLGGVVYWYYGRQVESA